jgi:hypothetical protein
MQAGSNNAGESIVSPTRIRAGTVAIQQQPHFAQS